jgi:hypothetical protein
MSRQPSRRTVVRTAVWSAPAVALATAAPALAISTTTTPTLSFDTLNLFGADYVAGDPTTLESQVQVQNRYAATSPTVTTLTLTVSYPASRVTGAAPSQVSGTGWSYTSAQHFGSAWVYTFVFGGNVPPGSSTHALDYRVPLSNASAGTITITGTAFASGGSVVDTSSFKVK